MNEHEHNVLNNIQNHLAKNEINEAKNLCDQILQGNEGLEDLLSTCGIIYAKTKEYPKAKFCFEKAIQNNPNEITHHQNLSNVYIALNDHEKAKQHLYQTLRLDPYHAESYNNLGRLFYKENLFKEAISLFEKALRINPDYWEAHYNLAHSLTKQNQTLQAQVHYKEVLRLKPDHAFAHYNLGLLLFESLNYLEAEHHLLQALELQFQEPMLLYYLAHSQLILGKAEESKHSFERLINEIAKPNLKEDLGGQENLESSKILAEAHHNLAVFSLKANQQTIALDHFEKALTLNPNNETATHMVRALKGIQSNEKAPATYISELFDQYADYYDEHLKQDLKYAVPGLLRNAVGCSLGKNLKPGRVLDLGCGTGLCGVYFRDLAFRLIGIDLSPKMLEKATALGAYDEVICGDFNEYLDKIADEMKLENKKHSKNNDNIEEIPNSERTWDAQETCMLSFDLILAADVLVYTGNLTVLFQKIAKCLKLNGLFAFTIELSQVNKVLQATELDFPYYLQSSGRYSHTTSYIHKLALENNLSIEVEESIVLRKNQDKEILGILFVLKKTAIFRASHS